MALELQRASRSGRHSDEYCGSPLATTHSDTVDDPQQWQTLIADNILWELPYTPAIGHPAKLSGRDEVLHHLRWFLGSRKLPLHHPKVYAFTDPQAAVAQVKAEALIKPTGRIYRQEYVVFLRAAGDKIAYLREYFDRHVRPNRWMRRFSILNRGSKLRWFGGQITTRCSGHTSPF